MYNKNGVGTWCHLLCRFAEKMLSRTESGTIKSCYYADKFFVALITQTDNNVRVDRVE